MKAETRFKEVLRRSLGNLFNHFLEFYFDTRGLFPKSSFNTRSGDQGVQPKQGLFIHPYFSTIRTVLAYPRSSFELTETSSHGNIRLVLVRTRSSFGLAESSLHNKYFYNNACIGLRCHFLWVNRDIFAWHHKTCLGPSKELITPHERPRHQSLRANCDVFASQHVNSHGLPKNTIEATSKIYFSLAN
jgi:hypothetical protein